MEEERKPSVNILQVLGIMFIIQLFVGAYIVMYMVSNFSIGIKRLDSKFETTINNINPEAELKELMEDQAKQEKKGKK